jgi:Kef-type K+ transport system membrane component KefB
MVLLKRIIPILVFLLIGFNSLASSGSFDPFKDKTLAIIVGLFVLGWLVIGFIASVQSRASKKDNTPQIIFFIILVVAIFLYSKSCS